MLPALMICCLLVVLIAAFSRSPVFGRLPSGARLSRIEQSPNYKDGQFHFTEPTPMQADGINMLTVIRKFLFTPRPDATPLVKMPMAVPEWSAAPVDDIAITWFGHSSYLLQWNGLNILVDPVFSERTSPVQFAGTKAFAGTHFDAALLPEIDILLISHDHYDHLDYLTIKKISAKVKHIYTALGIGAHLEHWGIKAESITELDWWEQAAIPGHGSITATPARHYTGRGFTRNKALWASFVLDIGGKKVFAGGDSGYGQHFSEIGKRFGPFELAILECGQYNEMWPYIHMMPEETVRAAGDLQARILFPVHWGKFALAMHPWKEPADRMLRESETLKQAIITPLPGKRTALKQPDDQRWWLTL